MVCGECWLLLSGTRAPGLLIFIAWLRLYPSGTKRVEREGLGQNKTKQPLPRDWHLVVNIPASHFTCIYFIFFLLCLSSTTVLWGKIMKLINR